MVLRKPYAFFIKHFRTIHIILTLLMVCGLYYSNRLLGFFNGYIVQTINLKGQDLTSIYIPGIYQFLPFLIMAVLVIILVVMFIKKKPVLLYIINLVSYVYTTIIIQVAKATLGTMESSMIDSRAVRLIRDIIMISFVFQIVGTIIIFVRSVGFDIKKFDFKQDLKELEINEEDREEFEVDFNIDKNKTRREIRRKIRFLKYAYKENKLLVHIVLSMFAVFVLSSGLYYYIKMERPVKENTYITNNGVTLKVNKSYITNTDYKGNIIDEDSIFIILQIDVKVNNSSVDFLDVATTKLSVGNYSYIPTYDYKEAFLDFGSAYLGDNLGYDYESRVLIYQIPKQLKDEEIEFQYINKANMSKKRVKLNFNDLTLKTDEIQIGLHDTLDFKSSVIQGYVLTIDEFDVKPKYKLNYNFCYNKECFDSYEYIVPSINTNTDKTILKIKGTLTADEIIPKLVDLYDVIESFGTIYYSVDGNLKINNIPIKEVISNKKKEENVYYIEVSKDIEKADSIYIEFKVRNKIYKYVLK